MITAVIIDDEKKSREVLKRLIEELDQGVHILSEADSVKEGVKCINNAAPQLVFLDVEMLDGTGFNLLEQFKKIDFKIIFTTAYDKYAVKAFKYSALEYLLKPIDIDELELAIQRAEKVTEQESFYSAQITALLGNIGSNRSKKIAIKGSNKIDFIETDQIICCNAESNYTNIVTANEKTIMSSKPLKYFDDILNDDSFFRVSKSHLINIDYVISYKKNLEKIELKNGLNVDLSRRRKKEFLDLLDAE